MATPAKLPKTDISEFFDVEGYVHSVTPTKLSVKTNALSLWAAKKESSLLF
jgi:hypothetical protein